MEFPSIREGFGVPFNQEECRIPFNQQCGVPFNQGGMWSSIQS